MQPVLTASEMKKWDRTTIEGIGIPSMVLMERASLSIAEACEKYLQKKNGSRVLAVCGSGNNGGDGACAARILKMKGYDASVWLFGHPTRFSREMEEQLSICQKLQIPLLEEEPAFSKYDVIIDAVFGIGLSRDVTDEDDIFNKINTSGTYVISADIPSGIAADTGQVLGKAVKASETVTMQAIKRGHLLYPGASYTGALQSAEIGILPIPEAVSAYALTYEDLALIPSRPRRSNKGTFGKLLVAAGSLNMAGAAYLSAAAALKTGCGMVKILTAEENRPILQRMLPEAMLETYHDPSSAKEGLLRNLSWADACVMGPGLGQSEETHALVNTMLLEGALDLVLDADGLNCLNGDLTMLEHYKGRCLIAPHPGEMSRLIGKTVPSILSDLTGNAEMVSQKCHVDCLLKDAATVIVNREGTLFINTTGNSGMATAGSGDVLSGIAGALICRGTPGAYAGALAAYLHGMAGDLAAKRIGLDGMTASDMLDAVCVILKEVNGSNYEQA